MLSDTMNLVDLSEDVNTLTETQLKEIEEIGGAQYEQSLKDILFEAYAGNNFQKQCDIISRLSKYHLQQQNYSSAAKLLNGAIILCQTHKQNIINQEDIEKDFLEQLKQVEIRFVEEKLGILYQAKSPGQHGINLAHKKQLSELRDVIKEKLKELGEFSSLPDEENSNRIQELFKWITQEINKLLHEMIQDCISLMPSQPPCAYALIGTGSLAREEMTPYSDLECFLLIEEDKPDYKKYFRQLSQLFELKIINFGETDLVKGQDLLPMGMLSPIRKGFSLDVHKNPVEQEHELIGTPEQMAKYQLPEYYIEEPQNHFSGSLLNTIFVSGTNQELLAIYQKKVGVICNEIDPNTKRSLRSEWAMKALKNDINYFEPKLSLDDEGRLFHVKEDLYRLPQTIIDALALSQNLQSSSTWGKINELCSLRLISKNAGQRLKQVLSMATWLRLKIYSYYNFQKEVLDTLLKITDENINQPNRHYILDEKFILILTEMLKTLMPLHQCANIFYQTQLQDNQFSTNDLDDNSLYTAGIIAVRLCLYSRAIKCFEEALTVNIKIYGKNHPILANYFHKLGLSCMALGDPKNAIRNYEEALSIDIEAHGEKHSETARDFNSLGVAWHDLGNNKKAIEYFEQARSIDTEIYGTKHSNVASELNNLGAAYKNLGKIRKAIECFEQALVVNMGIDGGNHPIVAINLSNLGEVWRECGNASKAIEYFEQALAVDIELYGMGHPKVATDLNNLGLAWHERGDAKKAIKYFEQALAIDTNVYGLNHPMVAINLNNLGLALQVLDDTKKSIEYCEQALAIVTKSYGTEHPMMAINLINLGENLRMQGHAEKAIEYFEKGLTINIKVYGERHSSLATTYNKLGLAWQDLGNFKKSLEYFEKALSIDTEMSGKFHPTMAIDFNNLGSALEELGETEKAIEYYKKALAINIKSYEIENPSVAQCFNNLGSIYRGLGNLKKAIKYFKKALTIDSKIYGKEHSAIAVDLINLGSVWQRLGNAKKAIRYFGEALIIATNIYGKEHPKVAGCYNNLGSAWQELGDIKKAVEYFEQALALNIKLYGEKHPHVASDLNNLGSALEELGDAEKAIEYYERALSINIDLYGEKHSNTAINLNNLGGAWQQLGDLKKAIEYLERALAIDIDISGSEHFTVAVDLNNLGEAWQELGDLKKAIEYLERALVIDTKVYGMEHPTIAIDLNNLGKAWRACGEIQKAINYCEQARKINAEIYGPQHPSIAKCYNSLGMCWQEWGDVSKAIEYLEQALTINTKVYGTEHPDVAINLNNLGILHQELGNTEKAIEYLERALGIDIKAYGAEHSIVIADLDNLGAILLALRDSEKVIEYYERISETITRLCGLKHPGLIKIYNTLYPLSQDLKEQSLKMQFNSVDQKTENIKKEKLGKQLEIDSQEKEHEEKKLLPQISGQSERVILNSVPYQIGSDKNVFFSTEHFSVIVNPENQSVPGILKIVPMLAQLGDWNNWQKIHWVELLQVIRLCELVLIQAFEPRDPRLKPSQDEKLINCAGKQRRVGEKTNIYFDIIPRYKNEVILNYPSSGNSTVAAQFKDKLYGKPFDFKDAIKPSNELYQVILSKLRETLKETDFSLWLLEDNFPNWESCISCTPANQHPTKTGLVEVSGFRVALDPRSQEEPGRAFCDTGSYGHVPALRYWKDAWIAEAGEIFAAYRATVNSVYPTEGNREFDWLCLMNLAKKPEGAHTHLHFIPRTSGGKNYGNDFSMEPSTYTPINEQERELIVNIFRKAFIENLLKRGLNIDWPILARLSIEDSSQNNDKLEENRQNDMNAFFEKEKTNQETKSTTIEKHKIKASNRWKVVAQGNQQRGWNCFDVAVGVERESLVKYTLDNAENIEVRQLLAPEVRHAAAITAVYIARKKEVFKQEKRIEEERTNRIIELFQIAETLKGEMEQTFIEAQANQLLMASDDSNEKQELKQLARYALPKVMHTEILCKLVNDYYDAHELMKKAVAECNTALGYLEGKRLSLEELDKLFSEPMNQEKYQQAYENFVQSKAQIFAPAEQRFKDYCESKETYKNYVRGYYGANQWFAFQRHFAERKETSMVDIAARYLKVQIFIHSNQSDQKIIYHTQTYGMREIHVEYNGINHFVRLEANEFSNDLLEEKNKLENSKNSERLLWSWNHVRDASKIEPRDEKEAILKKELAIANDDKQYAKQCIVLAKLAEHHLQKKSYNASAKLLNGAIAVCQTYRQDILNQENLEKTLLEKLNQVEIYFVEQQLKIDYKPQSKEAYGVNPNHKQRLIKLRETVKERLKEFEELSTLPNEELSNKIQQLFKWITREVNDLLHDMVQDCICLMRIQPPCDYALVGTGSLAREEMTPYSDLEYFLLIAEDKPEYKQYFKQLSQLFELKIINLGETDLVKGQDLLPLGMLNPTRKGFSLDVHKNPSEEAHELIGTPRQIALYQLPERYVEEPMNHLSGSLLNAIFISGSEPVLLVNYFHEVKAILSKIVPDIQLPLSVMRAIRALKSDADHFEPKLSLEDEGQLFQVKEDFYRLPQSILDALALLKDLKSKSTWDRINELCFQQLISKPAAQQLARVLSAAALCRLKTYNYYGAQKETLDVLLSFSTKHYASAEKDTAVFMKMLKTLIPLHRFVNDYYQHITQATDFYIDSLYDDSYATAGIIATRLCDYQKAVDYFEQALVSLEGGSIEISMASELMNRLGVVYYALGKFKQAENSFQQALTMNTQLHGANHPNVATVLSNLGTIQETLGKLGEATDHYNRALLIDTQFYAKEHQSLTRDYNNLGGAWREKGDLKQADYYYQQALHTNISLYGKKHPRIATTLNNLGAICGMLGKVNEALGYYHQALAMDRGFYGEAHPRIAIRLNNLGTVYKNLEKFQQALGYYERALFIDNKIYGYKHPEIITDLNNLGEIWALLADYKQSEQYYQRALAMAMQVYGAEHPRTAGILSNYSEVMEQLENESKALEFLKTALAIDRKVYGDEHPIVANDWNHLGLFWQTSGDNEKALEFLKKALEITQNAYGLKHPTMITRLNNFGSALKGVGCVEKAIYNYERALALARQFHRSEHSEIATILVNLASAYKIQGNIDKAKAFSQEALTIDIKRYGEEHPTVAIDWNNLGGIYYTAAQYQTAVDCYERALKIDRLFCHTHHPRLGLRLNNLSMACKALEDWKAAIRYSEEALQVNVQAYGAEHAKTLKTWQQLQELKEVLKKLGNDDALRKGKSFKC